jgi:hypothetical protein
MILFEKYGQHRPLNRQSERYARAGVELSLSTLADQVGVCGADPPAALFHCSRDRSGAHRKRHLAGFTGIVQADAGACPRAGQRPDPWAGYHKPYAPGRSPGPIGEALCWRHARRKFYELADIAATPGAASTHRRSHRWPWRP